MLAYVSDPRLNVGAVLEGSVAKSGNQVRITAEDQDARPRALRDEVPQQLQRRRVAPVQVLDQEDECLHRAMARVNCARSSIVLRRCSSGLITSGVGGGRPRRSTSSATVSTVASPRSPRSTF